MMSFPDKKVLRRAELDAFITTAIMPELMNADLNQELQVCTLLVLFQLVFCLNISLNLNPCPNVHKCLDTCIITICP